MCIDFDPMLSSLEAYSKERISKQARVPYANCSPSCSLQQKPRRRGRETAVRALRAPAPHQLFAAQGLPAQTAARRRCAKSGSQAEPGEEKTRFLQPQLHSNVSSSKALSAARAPHTAPAGSRTHAVSIFHPRVLPVFLLDPNANHSAHDGLAGGHTPSLVALLGILKEGHRAVAQSHRCPTRTRGCASLRAEDPEGLRSAGGQVRTRLRCLPDCHSPATRVCSVTAYPRLPPSR